MPAPKKSASSLLAAIIGTVGFSALAGLLVTVMVAPAIAVTGMTASNTLGIFESLPEYMVIDNQNQQNEIVAKNADGTNFHIATVFNQNREQIPLDQMSDNLKFAAVAGEDRRFYDHGGVDFPSVARAAIGNLTHRSSSGASTITMQLVRNIRVQQAFNETGVTDKQRALDINAAVYPNLSRKIQEMKYAIGLEKKYSKQTILAAYLNIVGMGGNTYGVQAAAQEYFSTSASNLTVAQAASLIAIVQNPTQNAPDSKTHYAANQKRRNVILGAMYLEHYITEAQYQQALAIPVDAKFVHLSTPTQGCLNAAPGFQFVCEDTLNRILNGNVSGLGSTKADQLANWKAGGYTVYVSIVPTLQNQANSILKKYTPPDYNAFSLGSAAVTTQVGTGRILDMAQNKDFNNDPTNVKVSTTSVNFADDKIYGGSSGFQPGSSYKPYTLMAFLKAGHGLYETFDAGVRQLPLSAFPDTCPDALGGWTGPPYQFTNDENETGPYNILRATAASVNAIFLQMGTTVDQCSTQKIAISLGVHRANGAQDGSDLATNPSCVIGVCSNTLAPVTQAAAFAGIANGGLYCHPTMIDSMTDPQGNSIPGEKSNCAQSTEVTPEIANAAAYAMTGPITSGTASAANPRDGTPYIAKTGTTDQAIQTWLVGSSHQASTALWIGNISGSQNTRLVRVNGTIAALLRNPVFQSLARSVDAYPGFGGGAGFPAPSGQLLTGTPAIVPTGMVGGTPAAAQAAIQLAQLTYADGGPVDSNLPAGTVASVNPGEGAQVPRGTTVTVYTSNGLASQAPNVLGMKLSDAQQAFVTAGWTNSQITSACVVAQPGETVTVPPSVVTQDPAGGASVNPSTTSVTLTVRKTACP